MAAGAPLIPEGALGIAALADLLIALLDILALVVLLGLLWTYKHTLGAVITFLVDHTKIHTPIGSFSLLFPLESANNAILAGMSSAALGLEVAAGRMFHALGVIFGWMVNLALYSATTLQHSVDWFKHIHLPRYAKWAIRAAFPLAWLTKLIAQEVRKILPKAWHIAKAVAHDAAAIARHPVRAIEADIAKIERKVGALARAVGAYAGTLVPPLHFPHPLKWLRDIRKDITRIHKRLGKLEAGVAAGVFAVTMANVLGVSARCLRKGNVGKAARRVCGMDSTLLDFLLADLLAIAGVVSVVTFAEALREVEDEAVKIMG